MSNKGYVSFNKGILTVDAEQFLKDTRGESTTHPSLGVVDELTADEVRDLWMATDADGITMTEHLCRFAKRIQAAAQPAVPSVPEVPKDAPLTATALAEALSCFWNAAIGSQSVQYDPTARAVAGAMAEGLAAVEHRLRELAAAPAHDQPEGEG